MDETTRAIAAHAEGLAYDRVPGEVVHEAKRHLVDTVACAIGGAGCEAARIGLRLAEGTASKSRRGRVLGRGAQAAFDSAAFVNTCMIRYLDFNDTVHGGHPSDAMGAAFALADAPGTDGRRLITGLLVAYETAVRLIATMRLRERGWDQGFAIGLAAVASAGHMLRRSSDEIGHAVAITAVANVPLRATRAGQLSKWKGAATAMSVRNGVYAAELAREGMTGPEAPFSGRHGVFEQLSGAFALPPFGGEFHTPRVGFKFWPVENNAQAAVWAAIKLREKVPADRIAAVVIRTNWAGWHELGSEPAKWQPETRETADHSLPYIVARALVDGGIDVGSFDAKAYLDPALRPLMAKIRVERDAAFDALYPGTVLIRIDATDANGRRHRIDLENPRGHPRNPMSDDELSAKFLRLAEPALGKKGALALECLWAIEKEANLDRVLSLLETEEGRF